MPNATRVGHELIEIRDESRRFARFSLTMVINKKRYDSELPYQRPDLIEVMEIEIDLTTSTMFILVSI